jgi:hypothetical protein
MQQQIPHKRMYYSLINYASTNGQIEQNKYTRVIRRTQRAPARAVLLVAWQQRALVSAASHRPGIRLHRPGGEPLSICSNWNWGASSPSTPTRTGYRRRSSWSATVVVDPGGGNRGPAAAGLPWCSVWRVRSGCG